jgi:hypothetical protein
MRLLAVGDEKLMTKDGTREESGTEQKEGSALPVSALAGEVISADIPRSARGNASQ